ncbi:trimeric autotransporter adhesin Ata [Acinetobacter sp. C32I]|uniref:trimeric autotransporter adhesin Ata n=2 Tax=Acinetobacter TaxID=469 RepID=UPI002036AF61|nr:trimeric autotransporter adhesin Ata [Acinetobacter sp. C32I]USA53618.1 trimeric autotransporter adhesin Ata [Acinetobacter sp. C32I]
MNKVYKVVWNASIGAWVATSELAKSKTKTKSKVLNLSAAVLVGAISFSPAAFAGSGIENGKGPGTAISGSSTNCREGEAGAANAKDIAIGCGAKTLDSTSSNIANRQNPYNNSTGAFAGAQKQGGSIALGTGATTEKGLSTAIGSYATTTDIAGVAIGTAALSKGNTALAIGRQSAATADFAQAIGNVAAATGKGSLAIGHSATAEGYRSIAIGSPDIENAGSVAGQAGASYQPNMATKATGKDSIAFGGGAVATQENSLAIGAFSASTGKKSVAIGTGAKANKDEAVVIGDQAEATFAGGVAVGKGARSEAENSIALGKDSKATQATGESFLTKKAAPTGVLSIGDVGAERRIQNVADGAADSDAATVGQLKAARTHYVSVNDGGQQGGNYENDGAKGRNSIAVGVNTNSTGSESVAVGSNARGAGTGAVAVGSASETVGSGDVSIGRNASTKGATGTAPGYSNQSIAIGDQTKAMGDQSIAIGADVIARGNSSVAIGGDDVDKIAQDAELSKTYTDITGGVLKAGRYPTTEANHGSTAVGTQAVGTGAFSSAFGMTSKATGDASSAFGVMSNAAGKGASAFGAVAQATGDGASAMGINSLASGTNSTAIGSGNKPGEGATATGNGAAAIGSNAKATGDNAAAVGKGAEATNENAAAIGGGAKATGKNSAAIGGGAVADQENAVAVGQGAQSMVVGGVALGARSRVEAENSVALGQDAVATEATGSSFLTNRDASMSNGVVSVGSAGKERRIANVEDGSADSDAVTVRQLKNVDSRVNDNAQNITNNAKNITNLNQKLDDTKTDLGNQITDTNNKLDDAKKDLGNQITDTKTELNNTINNTKTELNTKIDNTKTELENKGLNFAGNAGADVHRKLGEKLNIVGGADASTAEDKTSGENVITRTTADGIKVELLKDAKFDSITTGDTVLNDKGVTIKDGPSITKDGINAGDKVISNVADGKDGKDAVNVDQLTKVKDGLDGKITDTNTKLDDAKKDLGNQITDTNNKLDNAKKDLGNQITDTKTELNNTINNTKTELNTKIDNTKTELENKGLNFAGNAGTDVHRKLGEKLNIVGGADASTAEDKTSGENVITRTTADGIKVELLKDAKFDSITTGGTVLNDKGLTIKDGPSITKDGINAGNKVITNVADGSIANGSKDAVNGGQIKNISDSIKNSIGGNTTVNPDGSISTNNIGGTGKDNINDAIKSVDDKVTNGVNDLTNKGLNFAGNAGADVHRKLGEKLSIVGGADASTAEDKTSGENVITRTTADGIKVELLKDAKFDSITTGDTVLNDKGVTIKDGPSITKDGINAGNKVITNVADGSIANGSKDAVNGGQIKNISDSIKNSIGGNTTVNPDGSISTNNIGGTGKNNINDAISNVKDAATKAKTTVTEGDNIVVKETTNKDGSTNYEVSTKKDLNLDSITTGDTVLNDKGLTIKDGPSITKDGINAGNKVITNVADGSIANGSKDAVNGGQIKNISDSIKNSIGGNTTVNPDGSISTNNIGGTGKDNINDAIKSVDDKVTNGVNDLTNKGLNFAGNAGADVHRKLGEKLNIVGGADASTAEDKTSGENVITRTTADGIKVELLKDAKFDSITTGDTVLNDKGVTIKDGPSITKDGINAGDKVISNVADGKDGKDAVNVDQLTKVKDGLDGKITDTNTKLDDAKKDLGNQITDTNNKLDDAKKDLGNQITDTKTELNNTINNTKTELNTKIDNTKTELENKGLNFTGNAGADVHRKLGEKLNIVGGADASTAEDKTSGENVITRTTADGIKVELLKDAKFDSITTGDTVLNDKGVTIKDGPSITKDGINAGNKVITNVADGSIANGSKDAVNGGQIKNISDSIKNSIGGNTTVNPDGSISTNNIGGTGKDNINDAIKSVDDKVTNGVNDLTNKGLNFAGNAGADVHRKLGEKLSIVGGADASTAEDKTSGENVITRTTADGIKVELLKDAKFDSITTGDTVLNDKGVTIKDGPSITKDGINAGNKVITNVADGSIANGSKDAVNGGQIKNISDSIKNSIGGNTTVNPDGSISTNNIGGTGKDNINDAIKSVDDKVTNGVNDLTNKGLNFAGNAGADVHRKLGEKLSIVGGADASTAEDKTSGENVITRTTADGIKVELLKDAKFDSITTGDTVLNDKGVTIKDGPSITKDGINAGNKVITNVADGSIANGSKDAVNGGQIKNISDSIKNSIGGNTTVNPDGSISTNNIGGTGKNNINDAISNVKDAATKAKTTVTEGDNIVVKETTNKDGSTNYEVSTKKDLNLDSITTGDTVLNDKGLTIKDGPSITKDGINAGNKVITNVADGSIANGSKDAVNGGQIKNISDSIKNSIGGNTTVNPDGSISTNNIGGTGKDNINDAIKSVDDKVTNGVNDLTNKGLNFAGNAGADVHRKLGEKLNIVGGADASTADDKTSGENVITRTTEDGLKIELLKDAKFDSITTGNTVLNNNGLTIKGGPSITINGIDAGGKKITNVADGVDAKDAVNKGQLDKQINDVKDQIGKEIGDLSDNAVKYDKDKDGNVDKNSVTLGGGDKGTNLKNVADGKVEEGSKDAVNGGQLWDVQKQVDKNSNDIQNINNNINNINNGKSGLVQQQTPNGEITVGKDTGGTSINMAGKDGDRVVQGVKDGEIKAGSNQAVNGGQIHNISNSIKNSIGGETVVNQDGSITTNNIGGTGKNNINDAIGSLNQSNQELGNKINNLGDQLQQVFYDTNKRIDNLEDKMSAGIAATAALEQAPYVPGKLTMAVGAAYYNDQNAVGVTFRRTADNGRWSLTTGAALGSQGSPLVRIGVSTIID